MEPSHPQDQHDKLPEHKQTGSETVQKVDLDSGYLSDLLEESRKHDQAASDFFNSSSPPSYSSGLVLGVFDNDTNWDIGSTISHKPKKLDKACEELAENVKPPTRFPIALLPSTLARARAEANAPPIVHDRKAHPDLLDIGKPLKVIRTRPEPSFDTYPRTRFISKRRRAIFVDDTGDCEEDFQPQLLDVEERKRRYEKCLENIHSSGALSICGSSC